ncbi:adenosylcobinamide-GDP ribazoletransferase [bacterium]|nr:adenosylcobinamide-GDP ribazoletransferase [bacterium]
MLELISFFTRLPTRRTSIEKAAELSYLLPFLGIIIGIIVGTFAFLTFRFIDRLLATLLTVIFLYLVTGLNHLDGLADFADGVYAGGSRERKARIMKDTQTGIAGITFTLFTVLFLVYSFHAIGGDLFKIIVIESGAKTAMLSSIFFGKPMKKGMGRTFIKKLNRKVLPLSILLSVVFSFILLHFFGMLAILVSILTSFILVKIAHKNFGAINGDVIGAINELSRVASLLVLVILV